MAAKKRITREQIRAQRRAERAKEEKKDAKPRRSPKVRAKDFTPLKSARVSTREVSAEEKDVPKAPRKPKAEKAGKVDTSLLSGTFTKELPCELTIHEKSEKHERTTEIHQQIKVQELKAKEATKEMRAEISRLKREEDELQDQLSTGTELRPVECQNRKDYRKDVVETIRNDLDEVIEERRMMTSERQEAFPGVDLPPGGRAGQRKPRKEKPARALSPVPEETETKEAADPIDRVDEEVNHSSAEAQADSMEDNARS